MIDRTKKGFSLVEVMLLFTVLAVFMAASMPVITKKVRAVPKKASHGVYRCVYDDGIVSKRTPGVYEYLFQGSKAVYTNKGRLKTNGVCEFNVPTAAMYKIDVYSAGAGGTKYADVTSQQNDNRKAKYDMQDGRLTSQTNSTPGAPNYPLREPKDDELNLFDLLQVVRSTYTKDAGKGGDAYIAYSKAIESYCSAWDTLKDTINSKYTSAFATCVPIKNRLDAQRSIIATNKAIRQRYDDAVTNAQKTMNEAYSAISDACESWSSYCSDQEYQVKNGQHEVDCDEDHDTKNSRTGKCYKYDYKTAYYDSACYSKYNSGSAHNQTKCDNANNYYYNTTVPAYNKAVNNRATSSEYKTAGENITKAEKEISDKIQPDSARAGCIATTGACNPNGGNSYCNHSLEGLTCSTQVFGNKCSSSYKFVAEHIKGTSDINKDGLYYMSAAKEYLDAGDLKVASKSRYGDKYAMFDPDRKSGTSIMHDAYNISLSDDGYIHHQYMDFCKRHFVLVNKNGDYSPGYDTINKAGGRKGMGYWMQLVYPIRYVPSNMNGNSRKTYLKNLVTEGRDDAVWVATCSGYMSGCTRGNTVKGDQNGTNTMAGKSVSVDFRSPNGGRRSITDDESKTSFNFVKKGTNSTYTPGTPATPAPQTPQNGQCKNRPGCGVEQKYISSTGRCECIDILYEIGSDGYCYRKCDASEHQQIKESTRNLCASTSSQKCECMPGYVPSSFGGTGLKCISTSTSSTDTHDCGAAATYTNGECVCNGGKDRFKYISETRTCKPRCPAYFQEIGPPTALCEGVGGQTPDGCWGGVAKKWDSDGKCHDGQGNVYTPGRNYFSWWDWQKVSNPQQYFKGEEYNNLFTFKNTLNSLYDYIDTSSSGILLAANDDMQMASQDQEDRGTGTGGGGGHGGGSGGGATTGGANCNDRGACLDTSNCRRTKQVASWCPGYYICTECNTGYSGTCCTDSACGWSKDEWPLDPVGTDCVCPLGTDRYRMKPLNGFCNEQQQPQVSCGLHEVKNSSGECVCETYWCRSASGGSCDTNMSIPSYYTYFYEKDAHDVCHKYERNKCVIQRSSSCYNGSKSYGAYQTGNENDPCKCSDSSEKYDYDSCACVKGSPGTPDVINTGDIYIRTLTTKGLDVTQYAAFHIPDVYTTGSSPNSGKYISSIPNQGLPKGGSPGTVDIHYNISSALALSPFELKSYTKYSGGSSLGANYSFTAKENVPYGGASATPGVDAGYSRYTEPGTLSRRPYVEKGSGDISKQPRMWVESHLWTKKYRVGGAGTEGKHEHFVTTNLGANCKMKIPAGGPVLNLLNPSIHQDIDNLEFNLATTIKCTKGNEVTFEKRTEGGKYDRTPHDAPENKMFWWTPDYTGGKAWIVNSFINNSKNVKFEWHPTSLWAKAFSFLGGRNNYDLNSMNITRPGEGTTLVDYCNVPKGTYERYMVYVENGSETTAGIPSNRHVTIEGADGMYNGVQCYNPGTKVLYDNDPLVKKSAMTVRATAGGGGAIVITW